jgi:hypothetical protein
MGWKKTWMKLVRAVVILDSQTAWFVFGLGPYIQRPVSFDAMVGATKAVGDSVAFDVKDAAAAASASGTSSFSSDTHGRKRQQRGDSFIPLGRQKPANEKRTACFADQTDRRYEA